MECCSAFQFFQWPSRAKRMLHLILVIKKPALILIFNFSQVFEVYDSLPEPSLKAMDRVVSSAIDLCTLIYMGVGIAGYLAFADTPFTGITIELCSSERCL